MKITFRKNVLLDGLYPAMSTVSTRNTISSIEGVLIETMEGNTVRLSTYDMNKGIRILIEAEEIAEEGSYIINAQRLLQIVKVMTDELVTIEVDARYNARVSSGKSQFSLFALKGTDFPSLPELKGDRGFAIKSNLLKKGINKIMHSVAENDTRPMLCGANFKIGEGKIELVSCDSYTLSKYTLYGEIEDIGDESAMEASFIVPGHALNELIRLLPDGEDNITEFYMTRKHCIIDIDNMVFFTRMIDGDYIDYKRILPKEQTIFVRINREKFLRSLERATLVADEKIQGSGRSHVKLTLDGNVMTVTSNSVNGNVYDEIECTHEGDALEIGFNCRFLINSVRAAEGEELSITMKSPSQSITIEPTEKNEQNDFYYMVLPVRMNG